MLSEQEIQQALRASRVVPLDVPNPHGPLGLEELAGAVARIAQARDDSTPSQPEPLPRSRTGSE